MTEQTMTNADVGSVPQPPSVNGTPVLPPKPPQQEKKGFRIEDPHKLQEELENFVVKLNEEVTKNNGVVPANLAAQLHQYADMVRPVLALASRPSSTKSRGSQSSGSKGSPTGSNRRLSLKAMIELREQKLLRDALLDDALERQKEMEYRKKCEDEEREKRQALRERRMSERKDSELLKKKLMEDEREELRKETELAKQQKLNDDTKKKEDRKFELQERARILREKKAIRDQEKREEAARQREEIQKQLEASKAKAEAKRQEKLQQQEELRKIAEKVRKEKKEREEEEKRQLEETRIALEESWKKEQEWKEIQRQKDKEFLALKDAIKNDDFEPSAVDTLLLNNGLSS